MAVVAVGLYVPDHYLFVDRLPEPGESIEVGRYVKSDGGKAANQAAASALFGASTELIAVVGDDESGRSGIDTLSGYGVGTAFVEIVPGGATGMSSILLSPDGAQMIATFAGVGATLTAASVIQSLRGRRPKIALLQGETGGALSLELAQARIAETVVLDPSPADWYVGRKLPGVDILTPNYLEAQILTGKDIPTAADLAASTGVDRVIITKGASGAEIFDNGNVHQLPGITVQAIDTTGAGDAFNGVLAAALDRGERLLGAAEYALRAAAWSVTRPYCMASYARADQLDGWQTPNKVAL